MNRWSPRFLLQVRYLRDLCLMGSMWRSWRRSWAWGCSFPQKVLIDVAMVAFIHDIGKTVVSDAGRSKGQKAYPLREQSIMENKIFKKQKEYPWLAEVVGQVQERWDGQGTRTVSKVRPSHEYAQVLGLADRFERLINEEGLTGHEAIRRLLTKEKTAFRGSLLKTLVQQISLFPVGTVVRLNTGEVGTVEHTNPQHPLRPILRMTPNDQRATSELLPLKDLSLDRLICIVEIVKPLQEES